MIKNGNNGYPAPPPPVERPPLVPPYVNSVYNIITRRIRLARTIFGDRVKLVLRQVEDEHWARLPRPYLLVVPRQTRQPREVDVDYMSFVDPREVSFTAHFDGRMSEQEHLAANDIDTAERQLIFVLANWRPLPQYNPTLYSGMRIQGTRVPDVKVNYVFIFNEQIVLPDEPPMFEGEDDLLEELQLDGIGVHVNDPTCATCVCEPELPPGPKICVTGGGCPVELPPDPCAPPPCPPILGESNGDTTDTQKR